MAFETLAGAGRGHAGRGRRKILDGIAAYNRDDVLSNWRLRDWLEERRPDLEAREGRTLPRPVIDDGAASRELTDRERHVAGADGAPDGGRPGGPRRAGEGPGRRGPLAAGAAARLAPARGQVGLVAILRAAADDRRGADRGARASRRARARRRAAWPRRSRSSTRSRSRPRTTGSTWAATSTTRHARERRGRGGPGRDEPPCPDQARPEARGDAAPDGARPQRRHPHDGAGGEPAADRRARRGPRARRSGTRCQSTCCSRMPLLRPSGIPGSAIVRPGESPLAAAVRLAPDLDGRILPVQGPPGSGKTYTGAHMIVRLRWPGGGSASSPTATRSSATCSTRWTWSPASCWSRARSPASSGSARSRRRPRPDVRRGDGCSPTTRRSRQALRTGTVDVVGRRGLDVVPAGDGARRSPSWTCCSWTRPAR